MAGNHGDEYPGQVAILKLCRELALEDVEKQGGGDVPVSHGKGSGGGWGSSCSGSSCSGGSSCGGGGGGGGCGGGGCGG